MDRYLDAAVIPNCAIGLHSVHMRTDLHPGRLLCLLACFWVKI